MRGTFADPGVKALCAIRGGWGWARVLPFLDWGTIRANPKLLVGYSDVAALHLAFAAKAGFATIHAPNAATSWLGISWESFWRLAFAGEAPVFAPPDPEAAEPLNPDRWQIGRASCRGRV